MKLPPWNIVQNKAGDAVDIFIYSVVGESMWDEDLVSARAFVKELSAIKAKQINLRINSPGGSVFDGTTIFNALERHPANVTSFIDGFAGSIATIIMLAGSEVVAAPNSQLMIHDPSSVAMGTAEDMRKTAEMLETCKTALTTTYVAKTGKTEEEIQAAMSAETWFTAEEAMEFGLVDRIEGSAVNIAACAHWDPRELTQFRQTPTALAEALGIQPEANRPATATTPTKEPRMSLRATLGLGADATDEEVDAELARLRAADTPATPAPLPTEPNTPTPTPNSPAAPNAPANPVTPDPAAPVADPANPTPAPGSPAAIPSNMRLVDAATLDNLVARADRGDQAMARFEQTDNEAYLEQAIKDRKFVRASKEGYMTLLNGPGAADTRKLIDAMPKDVAPGEAVGYVGNGATTHSTDPSDEYDQSWLSPAERTRIASAGAVNGQHDPLNPED